MPGAASTPQLATPAAAPPDGDDWLHEIKFDGYRTMAHVADGAVRLITRSGLDWTQRYGDLADAFAALPCSDGDHRRRDRGARRQGGQPLRGCCRRRCRDGARQRAGLLRLRPAASRRLGPAGGAARAAQGAAARSCWPGPDGRSAIQFSDHVAGDGRRFYEQASRDGARGHRLEARLGALPARPLEDLDQDQGAADRRLRDRRLHDVGGGRGPRRRWRSASGSTASCSYRGKVGTGFDAATLAELLARLEPLERRRRCRSRARRRTSIWVRPVLSARIHYANRTADNALRHAVFKGLREVELTGAGGRAPRKRLISEADLATIWVTNPTRRLFGKSGPTKLDIAVYYAAVGDFMLPHILGRPVSLVRCPTGQAAGLLLPAPRLHRHAGVDGDASRPAPRTSETKTYLSVEDAKGYLALAQFGVVEFHTWGVPAQALETAGPDRLRPRSGRGHRLARDRRGGGARPGRARGARARALRQDLGRQGASTWWCRSRPKLDWKQVHQATGDIAAQHRRDGARDLHDHDGQGEPQAAHLHRLPPQRPQRHGGRALFAARRATICRLRRR